jgi:hypothetical protein
MVVIVLQVVSDEPLGLALSPEEKTQAVRVEQTPGEGVEEVGCQS